MVNGALATLTAVCGALGLVGVYTGAKRRSVHAALRGVSPVDIRSINEEAVVEVEGTAHPVEDPLEAPLTGDDAVVVSWRVEEWDERGDAGAWREIGRGVRTTPFEVRDGTGSIVVDVDTSEDTAGTWSTTSGVTATEGVRVGDVLTEFERFPHRRRLTPDATPGEDVAAFADEVGLPDRADRVVETVDVNREHGTRRYYEQTIGPGDDVYVYGAVIADEDATRPLKPDDARVSTPDDSPAVLSTLSEDEIQSRFERGYRVRLVAGAVLLLVTIALLGVQAIRAGVV